MTRLIYFTRSQLQHRASSKHDRKEYIADVLSMSTLLTNGTYAVDVYSDAYQKYYKKYENEAEPEVLAYVGPVVKEHWSMLDQGVHTSYVGEKQEQEILEAPDMVYHGLFDLSVAAEAAIRMRTAENDLRRQRKASGMSMEGKYSEPASVKPMSVRKVSAALIQDRYLGILPPALRQQAAEVATESAKASCTTCTRNRLSRALVEEFISYCREVNAAELYTIMQASPETVYVTVNPVPIKFSTLLEQKKLEEAEKDAILNQT